MATGAVLGLTMLTGTALSQDRVVPDDEWCHGDARQHGESVCEVREWTFSAPDDVSVDATPNGGVSVEAWDRSELRVRAKVHAWAEATTRARQIADAIQIKAGADIEADGPKTEDEEGWSVSYRVMVPRDTDLDLASTNGGIMIAGVHGTLRFHTTNGGVHLERVAGDVEGRTTNGGLHVVLAGDRWDGKGLNVRTTNGGVKVSVPAGYSAHLEAATTNGGLKVDFPVTVQGRIDRSVSTDLGEGGSTIKVRTTNGGVTIARS
jgi:DUF4097 and DUF4098 domain-containing protein YvlB